MTDPKAANPQSTKRLLYSIPALIVLGIAVAVAVISFTQQPADVFVFPRLVSIFFVILALWNAARAVLGMARGTHPRTHVGKLVPGHATSCWCWHSRGYSWHVCRGS